MSLERDIDWSKPFFSLSDDGSTAQMVIPFEVDVLMGNEIQVEDGSGNLRGQSPNSTFLIQYLGAS